MGVINPKIEVMEKLIAAKFIELIGREAVFLSIDDAIRVTQLSLTVRA